MWQGLFQIDDYQIQLNDAADKLAVIASNVSIRGDGAGRFLFASGNDRSIELSSNDDGVWVEYWNGDDEQPDHECLFHIYDAAVSAAIDWIGRKCTLDELLSCSECDLASTLRDSLDNAERSWPTKNWIAVPCHKCGTTNYLRLQHTSLSVGILDGFPAPNFVAKRTINVETMSFGAHDDGFTVNYQSLNWFVPGA